jgi:hypothetical protein
MSLEQFAEQVKDFVKESHDLHVEYNKKSEELAESYNSGVIGPEGYKSEVEKLQKTINDIKEQKATKLKERLQDVKQTELKAIEETSEPITTDTLAELTLLSQLELTGEELNTYINKYKRTPLAIKKLQAIARERNIICDFPPERKEYINRILGRMDSAINRFTSMKYDEHTVKAQMYRDGAISSIDEDIMTYKSL